MNSRPTRLALLTAGIRKRPIRSIRLAGLSILAGMALSATLRTSDSWPLMLTGAAFLLIVGELVIAWYEDGLPLTAAITEDFLDEFAELSPEEQGEIIQKLTARRKPPVQPES